MKKLAFGIFLSLVVFFQFSAFAQLKVGSAVKDFSLKSTSGDMVSMNSYKDAKGFIVIFTCNHCPYAKMYEERINALSLKYKDKGYPVIAINPNSATVAEDSFEEMKSRAEEMKYSFNYLDDATQEIAKYFGAAKTPHVYVISNIDLKRKVEYIGAIDDDPKGLDIKSKYVEQVIEALIANSKILVTETKAIGCSIKWK